MAEEFLANQHESPRENLVTDEIETTNDAEKSVKLLEPSTGIISILELLKDTTLAIPQYQRPYKWTVKNVNQLLTDVVFHKNENKKTYRLGTVVFHEDGAAKNIVDGQQRTLSLMLTAHALIELKKGDHSKCKQFSKELDAIENAMKKSILDKNFENIISQANIYNNYQEIERLVSQDSFTESHINFFLNKCEVVTVTLTDISEAFQFFDSQNSRGLDLNPHDLLKAYHLREFGDHDKDQMPASVADWESRESQQLATLFGEYLYRIRLWSKGISNRQKFTKADVGLFKGINLDQPSKYPHTEQLKIVHRYVDHYNAQYERKIDDRRIEFPFHIDQTIINGRRFFEFVQHYQKMIGPDGMAPLKLWLEGKGVTLNKDTAEIVKQIDLYNERANTGDRRVKLIFNCLLICYIDKFGYAEISQAIEKVFVWSYTLRLQSERIWFESMDKHVLKANLFSTIKEATHPAEFLNYILPLLNEKTDVVAKNSATKIAKRIVDIKKLFKEMNCYE